MLTAKLNDQIINCVDGIHDKETLKRWADKNILLCPACGKPYEYCHGRIIHPYFRHKNKAECEALYSEAETNEHILGKTKLYNWLKTIPGVENVELEAWIPSTKQRPDIMFDYNGKKHVLEYQCSPISTEYKERHELYKAAGIKDIWICGALKYFECYHTGNGTKKLNYLEKTTCKYYDPFSNTFFYIDRKIGETPISKYLESDVDNYWSEDTNVNEYVGSYKYIKDPSLNIKIVISGSYFGKNKKIERIFHRNHSLACCMKLENIFHVKDRD